MPPLMHEDTAAELARLRAHTWNVWKMIIYGIAVLGLVALIGERLAQ